MALQALQLSQWAEFISEEGICFVFRYIHPDLYEICIYETFMLQ